MFSYYTPFVIQLGNQTPSNFPVLVHGNAVRFKSIGNGGHVASGSGYDLIPFKDLALTERFSFQLEAYDASTGEFWMWVMVPALAADLIIYIAYGNSAIVTDQSNSAAVFPLANGYIRVYHLTISGTTVPDSSSNAQNASTPSAPNGVTATTGQIYGGADFDTTNNQYIDTVSLFDLDFGQGRISWWSKTTGAFNDGLNRLMWGQLHLGPPIHEFDAQKFIDDNFYIGWNDSSVADDRIVVAADAASYPTDTWVKYDFVWENGVGSDLYVNGSLFAQKSGLTATFSLISLQQLMIGQRGGSIAGMWDGGMDEFRIHNVLPDTDFISVEYDNQNDPDNFALMGAEYLAKRVGSMIVMFQ